jgi:SAM-dependent methyltransferase
MSDNWAVMRTQTLYDDPDLYDRLMPPGPCEAFYASLLSAEGALLDLACGTGRLTVPLAARVASATGLDASAAMLASARAKAQAAGAEVSWVQGDMTAFDLGRRFDVVTITGNSLAHLTTDAALSDCLAAVRRHLAPGGVFAFDVVNPDLRLLERPAKERIKRAPPAAGVRLREAASYDPTTQIRAANWRVIDGDGGTRDVAFHLRQFFPDDLPRALEAAGLRLTARYGEFDRRPFGARSRLQVCLAAAA